MHSVTDDWESNSATFLPTVADMVFLVVLALALQIGQTELLNDPGTPWHVRIGLDVWRSGPPHADIYSYTRSGVPWVSQDWLCDAAFALLYRAWSWNG